jgi:multicomponent Na+:H+ antiporter subunit D
MPLTTFCVAVAVAANAAVPLTAGFISKKLLLSGIEYGDTPVLLWLALTTLSSLAVLYAGVRILWEGFLSPARVDRAQQTSEAPWPMAVAMLVPAILLIAGGVIPGLTDMLRPNLGDYSPVNAGKIVEQLQMLSFGVLTYVLLARAGLATRPSRPATWLDAEWFYRRGVPRFATSARSGLAAAGRALADAVARARAGASGRLDLTDRLGQGWPTGAMALWVAVLLAVMLLFGIGRA